MSLYGPDTSWDVEHTLGDYITYRYIIPSSQLSSSATRIRVFFAHKTKDYILRKVYLGHAASSGAAYDFDGNQVQLFFLRFPYGIVSSPGLWSDPFYINIDPSKNLILSYHNPNFFLIPGNTPDTIYDLYSVAGDYASDTIPPAMSGPVGAGVKYLIQEIVSWVYPYVLKGTVKEKGSPVQRTLMCFYRSTGVLFSSTVSLSDGTFVLGAPDTTTEMFVVAFDDDAGDQYNSLVFDRVKGVSS